MVEADVELVPVSGQKRAVVPEHDVSLEEKALVILNARALDLGVAAKREDVVADCVFPAVMLMKPAVRGAVDQIVLGDQMRGPLVKVNSPAAVLEGRDVVKPVEADQRALLIAQCIDAGHVAEDRLESVGFDADVVDVVVFHRIALRGRRTVAPGPADRDARIPEAVDVVVRDEVVVRLADPEGHATGE